MLLNSFTIEIEAVLGAKAPKKNQSFWAILHRKSAENTLGANWIGEEDEPCLVCFKGFSFFWGICTS